MSTHSPPAITVGSLLRSAERQIAASGADAPRTSALALLEHASGLGREQVIAHPERAISPVAAGAYETLVARRFRGPKPRDSSIWYSRDLQVKWTAPGESWTSARAAAQ